MPDTTTRRAEAPDREAIRRLAVTNDMFTPEEWDGGVDPLLLQFVAGEADEDVWLVVEDGREVVAAALLTPEPFADRVWNLRFIATDPDAHGSGHGTRLLAAVEAHLAELGEQRARVLVVETSTTEPYRDARAFYAARGFTHEATIREYYGPGDGKAVFWKRVET